MTKPVHRFLKGLLLLCPPLIRAWEKLAFSYPEGSASYKLHVHIARSLRGLYALGVNDLRERWKEGGGMDDLDQ